MKKFAMLAAVSALAAGAASIPSVSEACRCAPPVAPSANLQRMDAVFYGKVIDKRVSSDRQSNVFKFKVRRVWKGEKLRQTVEVRSNGSPVACGTSFAKNSSYLIFASKNGRTYSTSVCAGNLMGGGAAMAQMQLGAFWVPQNADGSCPAGTANAIRCVRAPCPVKCMPTQR